MCPSHGTLQTATSTLGGAILAKSPSMSITTSVEAGLSYWASEGYRATLIGGRVGDPIHYVRYELDILDIVSKYSLKIPQIYSNMLKYT
jgi:hypothetical protein